MSLETILASLATAMGTDVKGLHTKIGNIANLTTTEKTSVVLAINELQAAIVALAAGAAGIDDTKGNGDTGFTWSANKIYDELVTLSSNLKTEILGGAGAALDTLKELADALGNDENFAATLAAQMAKMVRFDQVQTLTSEERLQARENIGAAEDAEFQTLKTGVGNFDQDLVAVYTTAKA